MSKLFVDKYVPISVEQFVGNNEIVEQSMNWAKAWKEGKKPKPLLLFGPPGVGKTALAYLIAKLNNWQLFELNASDFRTKEVIEKSVHGAAMNASFFGEARLILLDEIDGLSARDRGGNSAIATILKESQNPVILTANDVYADKKLSTIRAMVSLLQFKRINYLSVNKRLKEICAENKIEFEEEALKLLAKNSSGDMRSALTDLQLLSFFGKISQESVASLGFKERSENIFNILREIFIADTFEKARNPRFKTDLDNEMLMKWIEENIPRQYKSVKEISEAFNYLSRADVFNGRIRMRQNYSMLRYSSELMTVGVSIAKEKPSYDFVPYQFPGVLGKLSKDSGIRAFKKQIAAKMKQKVFGSPHKLLVYDLPYMQMFFENKENAIALSASFDLSAEEIAFFVQSDEKTKKVQNIFEQAQKLKTDSFIARRKSLSPFHEEEGPQMLETEAKEEETNIEELSPKQTRLF
ncbi:MAG: replication factor C large subunit [archaeon]|nr:replication factor C large subunit [archaeon]